MQLFNLTALAVIYYNLEKPNRYNNDDYKSREKARKNFSNATTINVERLQKAKEIYLATVEKDLINFITELTKT